MELSKLPVIISHANSSALHHHRRNIDDETLEHLRSNGGVIGVLCIGPTLGKEPTYKKLADHMIHISNRIGCENVAVGTDFFGLLNMREPEGFEDITKVTNPWRELLIRGMDQDELLKIAYGNTYVS